MISVSGVRGIVGESLTPEVVAKFSAAFGTYCEGQAVVIGRDARRSGAMMRDAVAAGLRAAGCEVIDLGVVATPTIQYGVKYHQAQGGIAITASHNPIQWNAMKFVSGEGIFLDAEQGTRLIEIYEKPEIAYVSWDRTGDIRHDPSGVEHHARHILENVDCELISSRQPSVAIDCCNSASTEILRHLLSSLGCSVTTVNCEMTGTFPREPEPTAENLEALCDAVRDQGAEIGFATDPDGDRISIVDEKGVPLGEEYSVTIATDMVLAKGPGPVVANVATTKAVEDVAGRYDCPFHRSAVGEVNVVKKMQDVGAIIGGEGNGGVINPAMQYARDGPAAMALILEGMSRAGRAISQIARDLPRYYMVKAKFPCEPARTSSLLEGVRKHFEGERMDLTDSIKMMREQS
jgi:phosphomannomutase